MSAPGGAVDPGEGGKAVDEPGSRPGVHGRAKEAASFVDALRLASEPSVNPVFHAARILSLERAVAASAGARRAHVAALIESALEAEAVHRVSLGLPPREHQLFRGWIDLPSPSMARPEQASGSPARPYLAEVAIPATGIVEVLGAASTEAEGVERAWDRLATIGFASCFEHPASCRGGRDRRRTLAILWSTLRRRRPVAAAVVRRCAALDRRWRRAEAGGGT